MAVKEQNKTNQSIELIFNNSDLTRLDDVIQKWNFKNYQSFFRFVISIMLVTEDKFLAILENGTVKPIKPARDFVSEKQVLTKSELKYRVGVTLE